MLYLYLHFVYICNPQSSREPRWRALRVSACPVHSVMTDTERLTYRPSQRHIDTIILGIPRRLRLSDRLAHLGNKRRLPQCGSLTKRCLHALPHSFASTVSHWSCKPRSPFSQQQRTWNSLRLFPGPNEFPILLHNLRGHHGKPSRDV